MNGRSEGAVVVIFFHWAVFGQIYDEVFQIVPNRFMLRVKD